MRVEDAGGTSAAVGSVTADAPEAGGVVAVVGSVNIVVSPLVLPPLTSADAGRRLTVVPPETGTVVRRIGSATGEGAITIDPADKVVGFTDATNIIEKRAAAIGGRLFDLCRCGYNN
jgi:hypothetical protein